MCRSVKWYWNCGCYQSTVLERCAHEFDKDHTIVRQTRYSCIKCDRCYFRGRCGYLDDDEDEDDEDAEWCWYRDEERYGYRDEDEDEDDEDAEWYGYRDEDEDDEGW